MTTEELNTKALEALKDALNNYGFQHKEFVNQTNTWHRYIQNELVKLAIAILQNAASDTYRYDPRNEWAHHRAKQLLEH